VQYLNEKDRAQGELGLHARVGKWLKISGTDTRDIKSVTQEHRSQAAPEGYLGFRGYKDRGLARRSVGRRSEGGHASFSDDHVRRISACGIHLLWKQTHDRRRTTTWISSSTAVLWGVSQVEAAERRLN
jgi:hypothetical protein